MEKIATEWDVKCMAYHESGHAVCSYYLPGRESLTKITIDPSEEGFGMVQTAQRKHHNETDVSLTSTIATLLAGRIAEEHFCGVKSTSSLYDLSLARDIALDMVGKFGMGSRMKLLAGISIKDNSFVMLSENTRRKIDADVGEILDKAGSIAKEVICQHSEVVSALAAILIQQKTLISDSIKEFFSTYKGVV